MNNASRHHYTPPGTECTPCCTHTTTSTATNLCHTSNYAYTSLPLPALIRFHQAAETKHIAMVNTTKDGIEANSREGAACGLQALRGGVQA